MKIRKLLYGPYSKYVIAILLGFGLATLFRASCKGNNCVVYKAAPMKKINGKIYKFGDECYTFKPEATQCDQSKQILSIA